MDILLDRIVEPSRRWARHWRERPAWYYLPYIWIALLTLILLGAASWVATWPDDGINWALSEGRILSVDPAGPGGRAGLRPGDVVLAIDGHPFHRVPLYADYHPGQPVTLTVERDGRTETVVLHLIVPGATVLLWRLTPIAVAASFWVAGAIIFALRPQAAVCRAFFLVGQVVTFALSAGQLSTANLIWAAHLFHLALLTLPPLLIHLYVVLVSPGPPFIRAAPRYLGGLSGLLALVELVAFMAPGVGGRGGELTTLIWPAWRVGLRLYLGLALLALLLGLLTAYLTTRSADLRRRLRGLAFGAAAGFVPMLFLSLLPDALLGPGSGLPFQLTFPFLTLIPLTHAYVVVKHDLAPFDRFLNRSLVVFILGLLWAALYLIGVGVGMTLYSDAGSLQPLIGALVTMVMAALLTPIREQTQRVVDRLFYGGWYDYRTVIGRLSHTLGGLTQPEELARRLVKLVVEGLRLQGAALYLHASKDELLLENCSGLYVPERLSGRVVQAWSRQSLPVPGHSVGSNASSPALFLEEDDGEQIAWYLPLVKEEKLLGLLLLGAKRDDDFFDPADMDILHTLREQATLAAENVLLLSDLRQTLKAMETAQQRLLTVREEERRILAWDLHDGPVQDLIALNYQLGDCWDRAQETELAPRLEQLQREVMRIMQAVRETCGALRSDVLDVMGVGPALTQYAHDVMQKRNVVVHLDVPAEGPRLPDPLGITLLRIFQEALKNAVEHAGTNEIWARLQIRGREYELRVWDEGRGFVVPQRIELLASQGHFGLTTIKERVAAAGGHLEVRSAPGAGTEVRVWGKIE